MKRKIKVILIGIILIIVFSGIIFFTITKKSTNSNNGLKKSESELSSYLEKFKNATYHTELVYYIDTPELEDIHHKFTEYNYDGSIEEYLISGEENETIVQQYKDYSNKKQYILDVNQYKTTSLKVMSHKNMLIEVLEEAEVNGKTDNTIPITLKKEKVEKYLTELNKHDSASLKYNENALYEGIVNIKGTNITSIIIKEKDSDKDIVYQFNKIGGIDKIELPKNVKSN